MNDAFLFCKGLENWGVGWLRKGKWIYMSGFETAFDAFAFCFATLSLDPSAGLPNRVFTLAPELQKGGQRLLI